MAIVRRRALEKARSEHSGRKRGCDEHSGVSPRYLLNIVHQLGYVLLS